MVKSKKADEFRGEKLRFALLLSAMTVIAVVLSVFLVFWQAYGDNMFKLLESQQHKADDYAARTEPVGGVVFFGDSLTEFCDLDRYYPDLGALNRGIAGDTTSGMLARVRSNVVQADPDVIVFLGGVNDLHHGASPEQITRNISEILNILSTETSAKIIVQSLYPVNPDTHPSYMNFVAERSNADIDAINAELPSICEKYGCVFVDMRPLLTDPEGRLKEDLTHDGLHVNDKAYRQIAARLTPVIVSLLGN